jgi:tRNA G18 (ribose-2'-O)-methylase SpoU
VHPLAASADDPRLADFVALNDPARRRELERRGGHFVVEGALALQRLLEVGGWSIRTIAVLPRAAERLASELAPVADRVVVCEEAVLREVVGFDLHRGVLASVDRRPLPELDALVRTGAPDLLVVTEGVNDHENLGGIYRNAAAFGCAGVVVDVATADPFYRRSIRVSLGHVLAVPTARSGPAPEALAQLRALGATTLALTPSGATPLSSLTAAELGTGPIAVVLGAEGPGLTPATLDAADRRVAIPLATGVDSLNVSTALAVALAHLRTLRPLPT